MTAGLSFPFPRSLCPCPIAGRILAASDVTSQWNVTLGRLDLASSTGDAAALVNALRHVVFSSNSTRSGSRVIDVTARADSRLGSLCAECAVPLRAISSTHPCRP